MDNRHSTDLLALYLTSDGTIDIGMWLKTNSDSIDSYREGGEMEQFCIFCEELHNGHVVKRYSEGKRDRSWGVHCCNTCNESIYRKFRVKGGDRASIYMFNKNRFFTPDAIKHVKVDNSEIDMWAVDSIKCYFCKDWITTTPRNYIQAPVDLAQNISGGEVSVCDTCNFELDKSYKDGHWDICHNAICNRKYPITKTEYDHREQSGTRLKHLCPSCTLKKINALSDGLLGNFSSTFLTPRVEVPLRYVDWRCDRCDFKYFIDLTIKIPHSSENFICPICDNLEFSIDNYVFIHNKEYSGVFHKSEDIWRIYYTTDWFQTKLLTTVEGDEFIESTIKVCEALFNYLNPPTLFDGE